MGNSTMFGNTLPDTGAEHAFGKLDQRQRDRLLRELFDLLEYRDGEPGAGWSDDTLEDVGGLFVKFGVTFTVPGDVVHCRFCSGWIVQGADGWRSRDGLHCDEHLDVCEGCGYCDGDGVLPHWPENEGDLVWESAGTDKPGDQTALSQVPQLVEGVTDHYKLGLHGEDGRWSVEVVCMNRGVEVPVAGARLGANFPSENAAKAAAWVHESAALARAKRRH